MEFRIADTFLDSLGRLTGPEQKAIKTTVFDLQVNPAAPGLSFHRVDRARDKNFWSVRVSDDIRVIVHRRNASLLVCYVDHHDKAYGWAERRKLETHPATGAAQIVEIRETVKEIIVHAFVQQEVSATPEPPVAKPPLFASQSDEALLGFGVPLEWLGDVRAATDDTLLGLADHLPAEAAEALLELATGGAPKPVLALAKDADPFDHPDAQRRFRVMHGVEELQRALEAPWEKWIVFLHPEQRQWVERSYDGPAKISGSAGTGKTVVALHRAVHLAKLNPDSRVLLTTFSDTLAHALHGKLKRLLGDEPRMGERIDVASLDAIGWRLYKAQGGKASLATRDIIRDLIGIASSAVPNHAFRPSFLISEWLQVVDEWQVESWEAYRSVARLGRKTRLPESQRAVLWAIFERVRAALKERSLLTMPEVLGLVARGISDRGSRPFEFAIVDEAQDISVSQLRFLGTLAGKSPDALFFTGDLGQRIFQQPFSWQSLGVDVRGRAHTLNVNYRTTHQIRRSADRLLGGDVTDVDGLTENRRSTVSVINGPEPTVRSFNGLDEESGAVGAWIKERITAGAVPHEIAVIVRSPDQYSRAQAAIESAGFPMKVLDERVQTSLGHVSLCSMPLAKGLEFRAVAVMACDDEVVPLQSRIESIGDDADLQEVYDTERQLLYVACTRARDNLLISSLMPPSEFLEDLTVSHGEDR